jgi:hypothetical protein
LTPLEEYLYRCSVCGEALNNEEIIDVAIGAAKFRGNYRGDMPTIGCPGCNSDTIMYGDQEPYPTVRQKDIDFISFNFI